VFVDDTAHGHLLAMEQGKVGKSYIIAGPKYSLAEQISSVRAPRLHPAPWMMKITASMSPIIDAVARMLSVRYGLAGSFVCL
jgi:nucleoside-diphosphate-sugar epimerase